MDSLVTFFTSTLSGVLSSEAVTFIISMLPILELRGGLLAASIMKVPYVKALLICIIGNLLPIPFVLLFIERIVIWMEHFAPTKGIAMVFRSKVDKHRAEIEKYDFWGLTLFVGIPLPGTGAWTGSIVAGLIRMNRKKAFASIIVGVLLASVIMSIISYGVLGAVIR